MKLKTRSQRATFWMGMLLLVILAVKGLVVVSQFIGYASVDTAGGTITQLVIQHEVPTEYWAAVFGVAVRVPGYTNQQFDDFTAGDMEETNLLFDCMEPNIEHEVYATVHDPNGLDLGSLSAATAAEVDAYYGRNGTEFDSAAYTFTEPVSFNFGSSTINTVGTITYKLGENPPTTFKLAIAKTPNGTLTFVAIVTNFTDGFNGRLYNYQLMFPAPSNDTLRYYFWTDPNDVCPAGEGTEPNKGGVYGTVTTTTGIPVPDVIVEVAGVTNLTNSTGQYVVWTGEGFHNIYAIKTGYEVYQNNVTVVSNNMTLHDIVLEDDTIPNDNTGIGPGIDNPGDDIGPFTEQAVGPGEDEGPGEAPIAPIVQQPQVIEGRDYIISLNELNRKLRVGQFLQERIYVYSFKKTPATVTFRINGTNISRLIEVDTTQLSIDPNGQGQFVLTIFGLEPTGIFNGTIELEGDLNATIPVRLEVLPRDQLPVEALHINVETSEKRYFPSDIVRVKTDLRNMLTDQQFPVRLFYTVQNPEGDETLWTFETNVYLRTSSSLIKSFRVPSKAKSGDYVLRVTAYYLGLNSGTSTIFHVAVPFWQRSFLGMKYWIWGLILLFIAACVGAYFYIRKQIEAKKKYHLKVEYDELPKPGPRSIYVGKIAETDNTTYFNLENFKTHTIVAGSTGGGKSVSAQVIIEEALDKGIAVLAFDPTAQWSGMLRPCKDKTMLSLYPLFGMKKTDAKGFPGNIRQINDAREKIDIRKYVKPGEIQVFACHKLDPKDMDILVANAIREIFHANFGEEKLLRIMFVFDEVHRLLPKFGGSGDGFLQIERACREFRKWGLGVMLISQVLSDFVGTIKANINTEIQMRTRDEGDLERIRQKYGEDVLRSLVKATVGSGMVENPAYNRGKPYFVAFKPLKHSVERLTDDEIEQYNTYNDQIDDLSYSLEQLEKEGVDIFDLKLELKLALDKVKTGNFNMVKIYIEGLAPRIDKQWTKIGKKPKKLERELVDMAAIQDELKKAQKERDKYVADKEKDGGGEQKEEKKEWGWKDDVPPEKILNLKNGMIVINLASLYDEVSAMKDADLPNEFDPEPKPPEEGEEPKKPINHFADWVRDAIGDTKLANNLYNCKTKADMLALLDKKKNGEEIKDVKPPEWAAFAEMSKTAPEEKPSEKAAEGEKKEGDASSEAKEGEATPAEGNPAGTATPAEAPAGEQVGAPAESYKEGEAQPQAPAAEAEPAAAPAAQSGEAAAKPAAEEKPAETKQAEPVVMESTKPASPASAPEQPAQPAAEPAPQPAPSGEPEKQEEAKPEPTPVIEGGATMLNRPREEEKPAEATPEAAAPESAATQAAQPVAAAKSGPGLDELVVQNEEDAFKLENGVAIHGIKELREYLPQMEDDLFQKHVGLDYNHFADWISGVFHNEELAQKVAHARNKEEMIAALT